MCSHACKNGQVCKRDPVTGKHKCWQHDSVDITVELILIRHGFSCTNAISMYGEDHPEWFKLSEKDPSLTNRSLSDMKKAKRPRNIDFVFASTMLRAQETALTLFPSRDVIVVPFMKEVGKGMENQISSTPVRQAERCLSNSRVDRGYVTNGTRWTTEARIASYAKFKKFLASFIVMDTKSHPSKKHYRIALVTHSDHMSKIFKTKDGPYNIGQVWQEFRITGPSHIELTSRSPTIRSFDKGDTGVLFEGIRMPETMDNGAVARCEKK